MNKPGVADILWLIVSILERLGGAVCFVVAFRLGPAADPPDWPQATYYLVATMMLFLFAEFASLRGRQWRWIK
jgi:hypothetical protein